MKEQLHKHPLLLMALLVGGSAAAFVGWGAIRSTHRPVSSTLDLIHRSGFDWRTQETAHFLIHYQPGSFAEKQTSVLAAIQENAFSRVLELLGGGTFPRKIHVFAVESRAQMRALTGNEVNGTAIPEEDSICFVFTERLQAGGAHELMHVLSFHRWGLAKPGRLWLNEGLACYADDRWWGWSLHAVAKHLRDTGHLLPLPQLMADFPSFSSMVTYPETGSFVKFLYERHGRERLQQLWQADQPDVRSIYGKSLVELEEEWRGLLEKADSSNIRYDIGVELPKSKGSAPVPRPH